MLSPFALRFARQTIRGDRVKANRFDRTGRIARVVQGQAETL
jgi:hypothetical protein